MIFYFTGTGNSEYVARRLLKNEEHLVSVKEAMWKKEFTYTLTEDESVGFVFPVYFYGLPAMVREFAKRVQFIGKYNYVYAVITCGGSVGGAGKLMEKYLKMGGTVLSAVYSVKMPDNYVLIYDVTSVQKEKPILQRAEERLDQIEKNIRLKRSIGINVNVFAKMKTALFYPMYDVSRRTKKFYVDDTCVGCGKCAERCPSKAIEMVNGKPIWKKEKCDHCLSCITCNAVQYGKRTVGKYRYKHPSLRK